MAQSISVVVRFEMHEREGVEMADSKSWGEQALNVKHWVV